MVRVIRRTDHWRSWETAHASRHPKSVLTELRNLAKSREHKGNKAGDGLAIASYDASCCSAHKQNPNAKIGI